MPRFPGFEAVPITRVGQRPSVFLSYSTSAAVLGGLPDTDPGADRCPPPPPMVGQVPPQRHMCSLCVHPSETLCSGLDRWCQSFTVSRLSQGWGRA